MLPLLQVYHQQMAPLQAPLDPRIPQDYRHSTTHQQSRTFRTPNPYDPLTLPRTVFPIRTSQSVRSSAYLSREQLSESEHQLRRKTPNGTIDAGYDGSPAQLATGPPPLKQMILPVTSTLIANTLVGRPPESIIAADTWHQMGPMLRHPGDQSSLLQPLHSGSVWQQRTDRPPLQQPSRTHHSTQILNLPHYGYQPGIQIQANAQVANTFSPSAGYCPPPVWEAAGFTPGQVALTSRLSHGQSVFGLDNMYALPRRPSVANVSHSRHSFGSIPQSRLNPTSSFVNDVPGLPNHTPAVGNGPYVGGGPSTMATALSPGFQGRQQTGEVSSPARFKEKVLAQANRAYTDLLSYLHTTRKPSASRQLHGSRTPSKLVVYPKPPRPPAGAAPQQRPKVMHSLTDPTAQAYMDRRDPTLANTYSATPSRPSPIQTGFYEDKVLQTMGLSTRNDLYQRPVYNPSPLSTVQGGFDSGVHTPISNAKASVEMLTHLCEQSDWKWIDGMLLGGCLHYGLERYEQALEWFSRILELDKSHTEAISNLAATFYCLNRHVEAEQHWLKAVKLRPSYLEAVEHLVALLGANQRSQDVVEIIDFVQRELRLPGSSRRPSQHSATDREAPLISGSYPIPGSSYRQRLTAGSNISSHTNSGSDRPGFGSSGYSIPGDENGRILSLIHVKGNMLYALKDIDGASEAFEEAVLISTGRTLQGIRELINRIQAVLSPRERFFPRDEATDSSPSRPLLLPPDKALDTAQLVFANNGELPGLQYIPEGGNKVAAVSTTSNSLLSLAKIFQDAISTGTTFAGANRQPSGVGDILALYYLSLSLHESPSTANNVGILLASVQQPSSSPAAYDIASTLNIPGIVPGTGLALALAYYKYGLRLDPKHVHLHTNLGSLLKDVGQLDMAIQMYEQAVACDGNFDIALTNLANAVKDRGRIGDAILYYKRAVKANPEFAEAVCGLSTALNSVCDWRGRGGILLHGGRFDRWHVDDEGMVQDAKLKGCSSGLLERVVGIVRRQLNDASKWGRDSIKGDYIRIFAAHVSRAVGSPYGLPNDPAQVELWLREWAGKAWEGSRLVRLVERSARVTMRQWYLDKYHHGQEFPDMYMRVPLPNSLAVPAAPTVLPFHTFTCPLTAKYIRMISQRNAIRISCSTLRSPWLPASVYPPPRPPNPHLNIGYISSDFNNHPLAHLMQSVFGMHDLTRVKAHCYATTPSDKSIHRQQIEREAPVFRDVSNWSSDRLVQQIVEDGIHILVNLNGYTRGARNEVFAARPVPIQMSFMGFAGTLGAEWCDYLLADNTAIPPETLRPWRRNQSIEDVILDERDADKDDWVYSENIIFCRDTFFCCDHAQSSDPSERQVSWVEEQRRRWAMRKELFPSLPDDAIILGNFNQLYKIDPTTFRSWLRILANAPRAYLWLLRFPEAGESNLRRTAREWAGENVAKRILFTDVAPKQQHISRARVCDLFLDTPECNAHTTAADVLWSSTPLLTLPRYPYKMCSRMAASILKGALPRGQLGAQAAGELIASDEDEYERLAIRLANGISYTITEEGYGSGRGRLAELRRLLFESKWTCALFDTRRWVKDLERAYAAAWEHWVEGKGGDIYL